MKIGENVVNVHKSNTNIFVKKCHFWWSASITLDKNNDDLISIYALYHMRKLT